MLVIFRSLKVIASNYVIIESHYSHLSTNDSPHRSCLCCSLGSFLIFIELHLIGLFENSSHFVKKSLQPRQKRSRHLDALLDPFPLRQRWQWKTLVAFEAEEIFSGGWFRLRRKLNFGGSKQKRASDYFNLSLDGKGRGTEMNLPLWTIKTLIRNQDLFQKTFINF